MDSIFLIVILSVLSIDFIVERGLAFLNLRYNNTAIPPKLKEKFDEGFFEKSVQYEKQKSKIGIYSSFISFILTFVILGFGGFGFLDTLILPYQFNEIIQSLLFFGVIGMLSFLIGLPLEYYSVFVIEQKFGFNKMTLKIYLIDKLKSIILSVLLGSGIISLIVWFYLISPEWFWLYSWLATTVIMLFFSMFYSSLIVPLFNKQTPLETGELREAIEKFAIKAGFNITNIYVIDGSKRSTKANAYFTGFGPKKRIVLYDTLIKEHSIDELVAILAHEIGHYKKKHIYKGMAMSLIQTAVIFYILSLFIAPGSEIAKLNALAFNSTPSFHIGIIGFGLLFSPISFLISLFTNYFSRKNEYEADAFAAQYLGGNSLSEALIKLNKNHLSKINPHPWYVFVHYSHPTLLQRLTALKYFDYGVINS